MNFRLLSSALAGVLCVAPASFATDPATPAATPTATPTEENAPDATVPAQEDATPASMVRTFFINLGKGQIEEAYNELLKGSRINDTPTDVLMLKKKTRDALELVGGIRGAELLEKKNPGTHLYALTYVSLGNDYPLQWRFFFYKRADGWRLIDIRISDRLHDFFGPETAPSPPAKPTPAK